MNQCIPTGLVLPLLLASRLLAAQSGQESWEDPRQPSRAERRSGFAAGVSGGLALGRAAGYPNEASKIDRPEYQADTGFGVGSGGTLWLGGALTDWFTVGIGTTGGGVTGNGYQASGGGFLFHLELFPLFYSGRLFRDLGVIANFGAGGAVIMQDRVVRAEGGSMSCVGVGIFYEPLRFWQFSSGPEVELTYLSSASLEAFSVSAGMRLVFYGGP